MRSWRLWLLLLLIALLPVRGAVAAAMLCPPGGTAAHDLAAAAQDHHAQHDHSHGHEAAPAHDAHAAHEHTVSDKCHVCAAFCSQAPLVSSVPSLVEPRIVATVRFPALSAPPPNFFSDGQDRPPRTL